MPKYIMCYGDSNTHGYNPHNGLRFSEDIRWTGRLGKILGADYKIIEEGLNGRTIACAPDGEEFKDGMYCIEPCVRTHMPLDLVVLMLGSNDMKLMFGETERSIGFHMRKMIDKIRQVSAYKDPEGKPVRILLVSPILITEDVLEGPFYEGFGYRGVTISKRLGKVYERVAEEKGCDFMNAALYALPGKLDGLHLEEDGHEKLAIAMAEKIKDIFEK